ncbi:MAG: hypothetical protein AB7H96_05030 [Vicinamibacterales bacterium]
MGGDLTATPESLRRLATAHMQAGRDLMHGGRPEAVGRALALFDRAVAIRRGLSTRGALDDYDLAGAWLNRAEALLVLGAPGHLDSAVRATDEAVALLERWPQVRDARMTLRLATALQNRAVALRRLQREPWRVTNDLFRAIALLDTIADADPHVGTRSAAVWVNIADVQAGESDPAAWQRALQSAECALARVAGLEGTEHEAAFIAVQARRIYCQAAARCLAFGEPDVRADLVGATSDAAEDALRLIAHWSGRDHAGRLNGDDLFEFGRLLYGEYQPQFLAEFEAEFSRRSS